MNRLYKNIGISIILSIIIIVIISSIYIYNLRKPIHVHHVFKTGLTVKNDAIVTNNIEIEINGDIAKTDFIAKKKIFRKDLKGTITINGKDYVLNLSNLGDYSHNLFWGDVTDTRYSYMAFISNDLNTIYLSQDKEKYYIAAPAKTIDDYKQIQTNIMH